MSEVDHKVIKMEFNNSKFNKNIERASSVLDKFKEKLHFKKESKEAKELDRNINNISFAQFAKEATLAVPGVTALINVTNRLVDSAIALGKSMTIQPLTTGFGKYESAITSTKTIMNATGKTIDEVSKALDQLTWYSDETSYSFDTMSDSVGKFTAAGVKLEDAVVAVQGIANWAAVSGAGVQKASIAMYNLSQALALGKLTAIDWKSIEQANMATEEFKQTVIETAKELGVLNAQGKTKKGMVVTVSNFREALSQGLVTNEVLIASLKKYADYSSQVYKVASEKGLSAADAMEILGRDMSSLGVKAFLAAQEAKTFSESIQATKDAVASGWQKTYEIIFGNYEEATKIWTAFTNALWDIFVAGSKVRNEQLQIWKDMGGREKLIQGISIAFENVSEAVNTAREAFREVIPPITAQTIMNLTNNFVAFSKSLKSSEAGLSLISSVSKIVAYLFKTIGLVLKSVLTIVKAVLPLLEPVVSALALLAQEVSNFISFIIDGQNGISLFRLALNGLAFVIEVIAGALSLLTSVLASAIDSFRKSEFLQEIVAFLKNIIPKLQTLGNKLVKRVKDIYQKLKESKALEYLKTFFVIIGVAIAGAISAVGNAIEKFINKVKNSKIVTKTIEFFITLGEKIKALFEAIGNAGENAWDSIKNFFENIGDGIESGWNKVKEAFQKVLEWIAPFFALIGGFFQNLWEQIKSWDIWQAFKALDIEGMAKSILDLAIAFKLIVSAVKSMQIVSKISKAINAFAHKENSEAIRNIGIAIALFAASLFALSKIDPKNVWTMVAALSVLTTVILGLLTATNLINQKRSIGELFIPEKKAKISIISLIGLGAALLMFASAVKKLAEIEDTMKMVSAGFFMVAALALVDMLIYLSNKLGDINGSTSTLKKSIKILALMLGAMGTLKILAKAISEIAAVGEPSAISSAAASMIAVGTFIAVISTLVDKSNKADLIGVFKFSTLFVSIAGSLWIIADAMKKLASFAPDESVYKRVAFMGLGIVSVLTALATFTGKNADAFREIEFGAFAIISLAASFAILSTGLETFARIPFNKLGNLAASMGVALGILLSGLIGLIGISKLLAKEPLVLTSLAGIIALLSGSIAIMAGSFSLFVNTLGVAGDVLNHLGPSLNAFLDQFLSFVDKVKSREGDIRSCITLIGQILPMVALTSVLQEANFGQLAGGGLLALLVGLGAAFLLANVQGLKIGSAIAAIALINSLSLMLLSLAGSLAILQNVKTETILVATLGFGALIFTLATVINTIAGISVNTKKALANAISVSIMIKAFGSLILSLTGFMFLVKDLDIGVLIATLGGFATLFYALMWPMKQLKSVTSLKKGLNSFLIILSLAGLMLSIGYAVSLMKGIDLSIAITAMAGLTAIVAAMSLLIKLTGKLSTTRVKTAQNAILAMAAVITAVALVSLAMQKVEKDVAVITMAGLTSLVAGIVTLVLAISTLKAKDAWQNALILAALAAPILAFAATIWAIGDKDWRTVVAAAGSISGIVAVIAGIAVIMAKFVGKAALASGAIGLISASLLLLLPVLELFEKANNGDKIILGLTGILAVLSGVIVMAALIGTIFTGSGAGLLGLAIGLAALAAVAGIANLASKAFDQITISLQRFGHTLPVIASGIIKTSDAIDYGIRKISDAITYAMINLSTAINVSISSIVNNLFNILNNIVSSAFSIGENIITGLGLGITKGANFVASIAQWIGEKVNNVWRTVFKTHSPSKVTEEIGENISEGLAIGIEAGSDDAILASVNVADKISEALGGVIPEDSKVGTKIHDFINSLGSSLGILDSEGNFNISAVINLDNIEEFKKQISQGASLNVGANVNNLPRTSTYSSTSSSAGASSGQIVFNQNNYSPKALTETEIYRLTRNELAGYKKKVISV